MLLQSCDSAASPHLDNRSLLAGETAVDRGERRHLRPHNQPPAALLRPCSRPSDETACSDACLTVDIGCLK